MKGRKFLFFLLAVAGGHFASAQNPGSKMDGILGIPFGADQDTAKKTVVSRTHGHFNRPKSQDNLLCFDGGHFAGFVREENHALQSCNDWQLLNNLAVGSSDSFPK
jgi:hypothetical protein